MQENNNNNGRITSYPGTVVPPGAMYVRALYDYDAEDKTSLSFRQGDIIQVITQLESGWWDGILDGVRGWFPSNYCAIISSEEDIDGAQVLAEGDAEGVQMDETDGDIEEHGYDDMEPAEGIRSGHRAMRLDGSQHHGQEEAAFWIPQATPDGRLFYFNTLTGHSTMELPFETPTSATETGPRDRMNVFIPDQTRPPPELMAGGYEREDDTDYDTASESAGPRGRNRRSGFSDGVSPATSMDSFSLTDPLSGSRSDLRETGHPSFTEMIQRGLPANGITMTSFNANPLGPQILARYAPNFLDHTNAVPITWNRLVEDMRRSVERYRQAINNRDRSDFVKRAEDISDHLRLILAAGSGTTDNHSGSPSVPSIISTNKALYPHFRDMMSRFSKLVLSSHIAAADFPPLDSYSKCLQQANGVLNGVYGYVEVARQQKGEDIPRLIPGFVNGSYLGGSWQNNGLSSRDPSASLLFMEQDEYEASLEPTVELTDHVLKQMDELRRTIVASIRRLDEQLALRERLIGHLKHQEIGDKICAAGGEVVTSYKPWISTVESINLSSLSSSFQNPQVTDFATQKQRMYDLISELVIACQAVTAPLGDEWAEDRGDPLEDRMYRVRAVSGELEACTSQVNSTLRLLSEAIPQTEFPPPRDQSLKGEAIAAKRTSSSQPVTNRPQPPTLTRADHAHSGSGGTDSGNRNGENSKVNRFFGEVPPVQQRMSDDVPDFLRLDYEGQLTYDIKANPPQLRGGTLIALVEQLTKHDRLDPDFNNTFLLTYRSFTTASELFELLVRRWSIQPPPGLNQQNYQLWAEKKQGVIRIRIVNILKSWFEIYWMEGSNDATKLLIQQVYSFTRDIVATSNTPGAAGLMEVIERRSKGQEMASRRLILTHNQITPTPILPKKMQKLKFLDIDATEFARQLTIIESKLYGKIKPAECLNKTWQRKTTAEDAEPAANVKALILHSNQLTNWVAEMILKQQDVKKRVAVIKHFVAIADKCQSLNNFSTLTSIISALGTAPIHRLQRTWKEIPPRTDVVLKRMQSLMASTKNFAEYRETLHAANPPCIPFFGVYLTDLTFIEDGIPSIIKKNNFINFSKRAKTAEVIREVQQYQNVPYSLQPVVELQNFILENMQRAGDVHEMYEKSLSVEPREREDERVARLLSESGFL